MSWGKAKTLLLVVFVVLNLVLAYYNFAKPLWLEPAQAVDEDELRATRDRLEEEGVFLMQPIPKMAPQMGYLPLRLQPRDPGVTAARFFEHKSVRAENQTEPGGQPSYQFISGTERLDMSSNGILTYRNDAIRVEGDSARISLEQARAIAEAFIRQRLGSMPKNARFGFAEAGPATVASHHLTYYQYFGSAPIFDAYIDMVVTAEGVKQMTQRWPEPAGWVSEAATIASASDILLRLLQDPLLKEAASRGAPGQQDAQIVIREITLGYYSALNPSPESRAFPAWRVVLTQGDEFIFNALTGLREYPEIVAVGTISRPTEPQPASVSRGVDSGLAKPRKTGVVSWGG